MIIVFLPFADQFSLNYCLEARFSSEVDLAEHSGSNFLCVAAGFIFSKRVALLIIGPSSMNSSTTIIHQTMGVSEVKIFERAQAQTLD